MMSGMPDEMMKLPEAARRLFKEAMMKSLSRGLDDAAAMRVAWEMVKNKFKKVGDEWVAKTDDFVPVQFYQFDLAITDEMISKTDDGYTIINAVLSDTLPDYDGDAIPEAVLQKWADAINKEHFEVDTDHDLWNEAVKTFGGYNYEKLYGMMRSKKGIAKAIKAEVQDKKLLVSIAVDKRYQNHIPKIKGLSVEASLKKQDGRVYDSDMYGFTFAVKKNPRNNRARVKQ